ncbi:MAG TPA: NAD(P)H-hydrate dehydratase, partial [Myxococcota bacterium]
EQNASAFRVVDALGLVPAPSALSFKNSFGHVAVIAGASLGAARLAARASLRAGAGLVTLVCSSDAGPDVPEPELMSRFVRVHGGAPAHADVDAALKGMRALAVGPGLGHALADVARAFLEAAARNNIPCVVDAEAIDELAKAPIQNLRAVITPHPGEAARALTIAGAVSSSALVQADRFAAVRALAAHFGEGIAVVLKGSCPLVVGDSAAGSAFARASGRVLVVEGGAVALAVAGSGDVLAGTIAGLLARGLDPANAAIAGTFAHQRAGKLLTASIGPRGALAHEIADAIPAALLATSAQ